jgi:peroxiredoxin
MTSGQAPEFDLPSLAGGRQTLQELLAAGPVLLAFFKVTCPTCQFTFPFLERIHRGRSGGSPQIVAISQDDARATTEFNRKYQITLPTLLDPHEPGSIRYPASNAYGITHVPTLFLVEQDGRISRSVSGFDKLELLELARIFGTEVFTPHDRVPVYQPG